MTNKMYDVAVKVGENNGKAIWKTVGVVLKGDKGPFMLLDRTFNPAGVPLGDRNQQSIMVNLFIPKEEAPAHSGHVPF
jgi:hypothetical protein